MPGTVIVKLPVLFVAVEVFAPLTDTVTPGKASLEFSLVTWPLTVFFCAIDVIKENKRNSKE